MFGCKLKAGCVKPHASTTVQARICASTLVYLYLWLYAYRVFYGCSPMNKPV